MIQFLHSALSVTCNVDILCWLSVLRLQKVLQQVKMATQKRPWRWKTLRLPLTLKGNYWRQQQWTQLNDLALHEFSLDREPAMCLGGYGFNSCRGVFVLRSCHVDQFTFHFLLPSLYLTLLLFIAHCFQLRTLKQSHRLFRHDLSIFVSYTPCFRSLISNRIKLLIISFLCLVILHPMQTSLTLRTQVCGIFCLAWQGKWRVADILFLCSKFTEVLLSRDRPCQLHMRRL